MDGTSFTTFGNDLFLTDLVVHKRSKLAIMAGLPATSAMMAPQISAPTGGGMWPPSAVVTLTPAVSCVTSPQVASNTFLVGMLVRHSSKGRGGGGGGGVRCGAVRCGVVCSFLVCV